MQLNEEVFVSSRKEHDPDYVSAFIQDYETKMGIKKEKISEKKRIKEESYGLSISSII